MYQGSISSAGPARPLSAASGSLIIRNSMITQTGNQRDGSQRIRRERSPSAETSFRCKRIRTMAYSELIKDFNKIRDYMRQFYVYGFKTRDEYDGKSARSYDNERRRIESWLGEFISFRQEPAGRVSFITVDSSKITANPLYNAFKAKSFTANDIVLNFCILDILQPGMRLGVSEITERIDEKYMSSFEDSKLFDEATVRNKLKEYAQEGILTAEKDGRRMLYSISEDKIDLDDWKEAIGFFSEIDPVGVIGSFLLDKMHGQPEMFTYKHHYILHALESDVICTLLDAISDDCTVEFTLHSHRKDKRKDFQVIPFRICLSTENGRGYLLGRNQRDGRFNMYRLDRIISVRKGEYAPQKAELMDAANDFTKHLWNTSSGYARTVDHLEMTLRITPQEDYILQRLEREGKHGSVEEIGDDRFRYSVDVYDAAEMLPWIRTFTGRIEELSCTDPEVTKVFYGDLEEMISMYLQDGGDGDAV